MMTLEQLPPKGVKREQAILALGKEEANGELLLQLVNTEKGKCKTATQKALAQLEYALAAPLWAKLVKGKQASTRGSADLDDYDYGEDEGDADVELDKPETEDEEL